MGWFRKFDRTKFGEGLYMKNLFKTTLLLLTLSCAAFADFRDTIVGKYWSNYAAKPGECTIAPYSNPTRPGTWIVATNQYGMAAYGYVDGRASVITLVDGSWPDATSDHPLVGTLEDDNGAMVIHWGKLKNGQDGGSWARR